MGESCHEKLKLLNDDPDVNNLANNLRTRCEAVNNIRKKEGFSIAFLKEVTTFVSYMNGQAAFAILGCKQNISASNKSFKLVISEYLENSDQLLELCSALDKFVKSARDSHSYTQYVVQQYFENKMETEYCLKILEKLKKLKSSEDVHAHTAESLHQKIKDLITQFYKLCRNLEQEIAEIDKEKILVGTKKKRTSLAYKSVSMIVLVCAGSLVGADFLPELAEMISGIADSASAVADVADGTLNTIDVPTEPGQDTLVDWAKGHETASKYIAKTGVLGVVTVPLNVGHSLAMSYYGNKQDNLDKKQKDMDAVRRESEASITELGNIKFRINQIVNQIDSLLAKTNTAVEMSDVDFLMKDMKQTLEQFMNKIDDLDAEAVKCSAETLKTRDNVCSLIKL